MASWLEKIFSKSPTAEDLAAAIGDMNAERDRLSDALRTLADRRAGLLLEGDIAALGKLDNEAGDLQRRLDVIGARLPVLEAERGKLIEAAQAARLAEVRAEYAAALGSLGKMLTKTAEEAQRLATLRETLAAGVPVKDFRDAPHTFSAPLNPATVAHWRNAVAQWDAPPAKPAGHAVLIGLRVTAAGHFGNLAPGEIAGFAPGVAARAVALNAAELVDPAQTTRLPPVRVTAAAPLSIAGKTLGVGESIVCTPAEAAAVLVPTVPRGVNYHVVEVAA